MTAWNVLEVNTYCIAHITLAPLVMFVRITQHNTHASTTFVAKQQTAKKI